MYINSTETESLHTTLVSATLRQFSKSEAALV